ncbi:hypothetical protein [Streptomyces sp. NPDC002851]
MKADSVALMGSVRPRTADGSRTRWLIVRLLFVVLALAAASAVCDPAMAAPGYSGVTAVHQVAADGASDGDASDPATIDAARCELCSDDDGPRPCADPDGEGVRDTVPYTGPYAVPDRGQPCAPDQRAPLASARDGAVAAPRPPDLHLLQLLRV